MLLGGVGRLVTVRWGDPFLFHPDEKGFVMWEAASIEWRGLTRDDWRPRTTTYGPVVYELAIGLKWAFLGGLDEARRDVALYPDDWAYVSAANAGWLEGEPFSMLAWTQLVRTFMAITSALAIALLALAAWRLSGPVAGAVAAWLAAPCVGLVQASHLATTDSLVLVEIAMVLHASARLARGGGLGAAAYAGVALGLVAATKTTGLLLLAVLPIAIASDTRAPFRGAVRALATARFGLAVVLAIAVYTVLCPWGVFDRATYEAVGGNVSGVAVLRSQYTDHDYGFYDWRFPYNGTTPYLYTLTHVLSYAVGVPVLIAAIAGLARSRRASALDARIALAAALPTFLLVGMWGVKTIRYAMPMVPGLLLAAALVLARMLDRGALARVIAVLVIAAGLARGVAFTGMFLEPDPRTLAGRWLLDRIEPGDVVALEPEGSYTAPLGTNDDGVGIERVAPHPIAMRKLWWGAPADVRGHVDRALRGARFVVVGEIYRRRGMHPEATWRAPMQARFYRALFAGETGFELVATFAREPRLGPIAWDESDAEPFAVAFDHMPVYVFERRGEYVSPFE